MANQKITMKPGINRQLSATLNEGGYTDGSRVRFRFGVPQKIGGWIKWAATLLTGACRTIHAWSQLNTLIDVAFGTHDHVYISQGGTLYDVTPVDGVISPGATSIAATTGSAVLVVTTGTNHGRAVGDWVTFDAISGTSRTPSGISGAGITLAGDYKVASVISLTSLTIVAATAATATAGIAAATLTCFLSAGLPSSITGTGWGAGTWGGVVSGTGANFTASISGTTMTVSAISAGAIVVGMWVRGTGVSVGPPGSGYTYVTALGTGTGGVGTYTVGPSQTVASTTMTGVTGTGWGAASASGTTLLPARVWSLDNWGEDLLAIPTQGKLYSWFPSGSGSISSRLAVVTNSGTPAYGPPLVIGQGFVAMPERHLILLGSSTLNSNANYDPMLVRWSDAEDFTSYFALTTNSAGSARLQGGSQIIGALNTQAQTLLWTDTMVYTMRFIGTPYVYRFDALGQNCGLIAQHARAMLSGVIYWMSSNAFFKFNGGTPTIMACTLWDDVFSTLNQSQQAKVTCVTVAAFGEVTWFYPAGASIEPNRYVTYNSMEDVWYGGALDRGAFMDAGVLASPIGVNASGQVYAHEVGVDADGAAMGEYLLSGYADIADGEDILFIRSFIPDFQYLTGAITLSLYATLYPNATPRLRGPYTVTNASTNINARTRGRQVAFRIDGGGVGSNWRLGATRYDAQADGSR